LTPDGVIRIFH